MWNLPKVVEDCMFERIVETNLTYGQAMDKAFHEGQKVARSIWSGYWEAIQPEPLTVPVLVATLKDNAGVVTATAYAEDKVAKDWMVVD